MLYIVTNVRGQYGILLEQVDIIIIDERIDMTTKEFRVQCALGSISIEGLQKLAEDPQTSKEMLNVMSNSIYPTVRVRVAKNINTPGTTLNKLLDDPYWAIQTNAGSNLSRFEERKKA